MPVAFVEVDGPQHYQNDGSLKRKDIMKEALYRGKYPQALFTRVRYDQVDRLGSSYVGTHVAEYFCNTPSIRLSCAHGGAGTTRPVHGPSGRMDLGASGSSGSGATTSPDSCSVVYEKNDEDGLAARRFVFSL